MKLVQVAGFLGSGKTTFIIALSKILSKEGLKIAILVNDVGQVPIDGKVMNEYGLTVKDIGGGCICCQVAGNMLKTLGLLAAGARPDLIIIEPTGVAVPGAIRQAVLGNAAKMQVETGPVIVLFDMTRTEKLLSYDTLKKLVTTQIKDADIIALSKADMVSAEEANRAQAAVSAVNDTARIIRLSVKTAEGLQELADAVREITVEL